MITPGAGAKLLYTAINCWKKGLLICFDREYGSRLAEINDGSVPVGAPVHARLNTPAASRNRRGLAVRQYAKRLFARVTARVRSRIRGFCNC